jgi:cyclohexanone monooxygenase
MTATAERTDQGSQGGTEVLDTLIIGGGFSGIYMLDRLRDEGFSVKAWDVADSFGGIWWWNCYPGARTDTIGHNYQFNYKDLWKEFDFPELYPDWTQVRRYLNYVNDKLDLEKDIEFKTFGESADWDEESRTWTVRSSDGKVVACRNLVIATGFGAKPLYPDIPGLDTFAGECHHTARWPQGGLDMTGKKVVVFGTGASGVQVIQEAGKVAESVTVFQRTPNLALPMRQRQLTPEDNDEIREGLPERFETRRRSFAGFDFDFHPVNALDVPEEERTAYYERMWQEGGFALWVGMYQDIYADEEANRTFYDFWRNKVHARMQDKDKAEIMAPKTWPHPFGIKRPSLEQNFYETIDQDNVHLVNSAEEPILRVEPEGVVTKNGLIECDVLVLASGFDNNRGGIMAIDVTGVDGQKLQEKWDGYIETHFGLTTHGFPNLLFLYGPQSPSGFCNGPTSAEEQGEIAVQLLKDVRNRGVNRFENGREVEVEWTKHLDEVFAASMFPRAKSWYWGANVPGKTPQMLNYCGGLKSYFDQWEAKKDRDYEGISFG